MDGTQEESKDENELLLPDEEAIIGDDDNDLGPSQSPFDDAPLRITPRETSVATAAREVEQLSASEEALMVLQSCEDDAAALEASWRRSIIIRPFFSFCFNPRKLVNQPSRLLLFLFYSDVRIKKSSSSMWSCIGDSSGS